jgi:MFS family permease
MGITSPIRSGSISRNQAWLLVALSSFAYFLNYTDRQTIFSIFPILKSELGFSNVELGLTGSIFLWVYGLSSPIAGRLADRYSRYHLVSLSLMLWSVVTIFTRMANSPAAILACRGLMGITEALFVPAAVALIGQVHDSGSRSRAIGLMVGAQLAGLAMGGWYGGFVAQRYGWRFAFYLLGIAGVIYAVPFDIFLRNSSKKVTAPPRSESTRLPWQKLLQIPTYIYLCLCFPIYNSILWLLYTWLPDILYEKFHMTLAKAGFTAAIYMQSATLLGLLVGSIVADRLCRRANAIRFWLVCGGILFSALWSYGIGHSGHISSMEISVLGVGFGSGLFIANLMASALDVVPPHGHGLAVGIINIVGAPISGLAALLGGSLKNSIGVSGVISYAALLSICAGCLLIFGVKRHFRGDYIRAHSPKSLEP